MSNGNTFNWLSFLLGLAIGLWISVVGLFLMDRGNDCDCGPPGTTVNTYQSQNYAWIPGGDGAYYCANNDEGGAIVLDEGGAIVVDEGGSIIVDEHGVISVDEGSAIVVDNGGFLPAPNSSAEQLDNEEGRGFEVFRCATNDEGGAIIVDSAGRIVVVSMSADDDPDRCVRDNTDARVRNDAGQPVQIDEGGAVVVDEGGSVVVDAADAEGTLSTSSLPDGDPHSNSPLVYCMVAKADSEPIVIGPTLGR